MNKVEPVRPDEPAAPPAAHPARRLAGRLWPPAFFLLVALVFSWPLALRLGDQVILAGSGDVWQHLWNNWWMRFSLLELHTHPYTTPLLFHPVGANLFFHALDPLDGYLSTPFQLLFGVVASFNLVILFQLTVAGYGAFLLARYLTGNRPAALVAGLIYACSPLESRLLNLGQLELSSIEWLPLYILCFIKTLNRDPRPWLWRGLSVLLLLVMSLNTWYYLLYGLMFSLLYLLYRLWLERAAWRQAWPRTLALAAGVVGVYLVLILPVLVPTLLEAGQGGARQPIFTVIYNSATVRGLFTTGPSALWGLFGSADNPEYRGNFLGYVALSLALLGLLACFRRAWFWGGVAALFVLLALGPVLHFSFDPDWTPQTALPGPSLPGRLLFELPFGNIARVPLRYGLVTMLCLGVLAAYGLDWLGRRFQPGWPRRALPALAGALVFLEFFPGPRPVADTTIPSFYRQLGSEGRWNDFAVLETPDRADASIISRAMYFQTAHAHPIVGGYLSRKPTYPFRDYPGISELLNLEQRLFQRDILDRASLANAVGVLQYYKIRYVILHPPLLRSEDIGFNAREVLQTVFGREARPYYEDGELQVWRVPDAPPPAGAPDAARVLPQLAEGWGNRLDAPAGVERQVGRQARLALFNPYSQPVRLSLNTTVRAAESPVRLEILINRQALPEREVTSVSQNETLPLTLNPGLNEVIFKVSGPVYFGRFNLVNS